MLKTNGSYRFKADIFFPWLLLFTLLSVITMTCWQVEVLSGVFGSLVVTGPMLPYPTATCR